MTMIILTKEQADTVRGPAGTGVELNPVPMKDGTFVLAAARTLAVVTDAAKLAVLQHAPQREVAYGEKVGDDDTQL